MKKITTRVIYNSNIKSKKEEVEKVYSMKSKHNKTYWQVRCKTEDFRAENSGWKPHRFWLLLLWCWLLWLCRKTVASTDLQITQVFHFLVFFHLFLCLKERRGGASMKFCNANMNYLNENKLLKNFPYP